MGRFQRMGARWRWRSQAAAALLLSLACGTAAAQDAATARYAVTVSLNWSEARHPFEFPETAHWSRLLIAAHSGRFSLFRDGDTASSGMALLATNGRVSVLEAELAEGRRRGRVGEHVVLGGRAGGATVFEAEVSVTEGAPMVSLATMLAPSPDWFAGVAAVALRADTGWRDREEAPLYVWDAGADSGESFSAPNQDTQPRQSIRLLVHPAFLTPDGLRPIGAAVFRRIE